MIQQYDGSPPDPSPDSPVTCLKCDTRYTDRVVFSQHLLLHIERERPRILLDRTIVQKHQKRIAFEINQLRRKVSMSEEGETEMNQEEVEVKPKPFLNNIESEKGSPENKENPDRDEGGSESEDRMSICSTAASDNPPKITIKADVHASDDQPAENGRPPSANHSENSPEGFKGFKASEDDDSQEKPSEGSKSPAKPTTPSLPNIAISVRKSEDLMAQTNYSLIQKRLQELYQKCKGLTGRPPPTKSQVSESSESVYKSESLSGSASSIVSNSQSSTEHETSFTGLYQLGVTVGSKFGRIGSQESVVGVKNKVNPQTANHSGQRQSEQRGMSGRELQATSTESQIGLCHGRLDSFQWDTDQREELKYQNPDPLKCQVGLQSQLGHKEEIDGRCKLQTRAANQSTVCQPQLGGGLRKAADNLTYLTPSHLKLSQIGDPESWPPERQNLLFTAASQLAGDRQFRGGQKADQCQTTHKSDENQAISTSQLPKTDWLNGHPKSSATFTQDSPRTDLGEKPEGNPAGWIPKEIANILQEGSDDDCSISSDLDGGLRITPEDLELCNEADSMEELRPQAQGPAPVEEPQVDVPPKLSKNRKTIADYFAPFKKPGPAQDVKRVEESPQLITRIGGKIGPIQNSNVDLQDQCGAQKEFPATPRPGSLKMSKEIPGFQDSILGCQVKGENNLLDQRGRSEDSKEIERLVLQNSGPCNGGNTKCSNGQNERQSMVNKVNARPENFPERSLSRALMQNPIADPRGQFDAPKDAATPRPSSRDSVQGSEGKLSNSAGDQQRYSETSKEITASQDSGLGCRASSEDDSHLVEQYVHSKSSKEVEGLISQGTRPSIQASIGIFNGQNGKEPSHHQPQNKVNALPPKFPEQPSGSVTNSKSCQLLVGSTKKPRPNLSVQRISNKHHAMLPQIMTDSGLRAKTVSRLHSQSILTEPCPDVTILGPSSNYKRLPQMLTDSGTRGTAPKPDTVSQSCRQLSRTQVPTGSNLCSANQSDQNSKSSPVPIDVGRRFTVTAEKPQLVECKIVKKQKKMPPKNLMEFSSEDTSCSGGELKCASLSSEEGNLIQEDSLAVLQNNGHLTPTSLERQGAETLPDFNQAFPGSRSAQIAKAYEQQVDAVVTPSEEDLKQETPSVESSRGLPDQKKGSKKKKFSKKISSNSDSDSSGSFKAKRKKIELVDSPLKPLRPVMTGDVKMSPCKSYVDLDSVKEDFANGDFHNAQKALFRCALCPKTFSTSEELDAHTAADGHIICSMSDACAGLSFESPATLAHHQAMVHGAPSQTTAVQRLAAQVERLPQTFQGFSPVQQPPYNPPQQPYNPPQQFNVPPAAYNGPKLGSQVVLTPMSGAPQPPAPAPSLPNLPGIQVTKRPAAPQAEIIPPKINRSDGMPNVRLPDSITLVKSQPAPPPQNNVADMLATRGITMVASGSRQTGSATIQPVSPKRLPNVPSAISIVPSRAQPQPPQQAQRFAVPPAPQRRVTNLGMVDLTKDDLNGRLRAGRPPVPNQRRFTCTFCDKVYPTAESLQAHMAIHGQKTGRFMCDVCRVVYTNEAKLAHHKRTVHPNKTPDSGANGPEFAIPIVDVNQAGVKEKLLQCGIRHIVQLSNLRNANDTATFGLPIIPIDLARNEAFSRLDDLGASNILTLGTLKSIYR